MPPVTKTPRLIRRGDVVMIKGTNQEEIVRGVQIVLQLANGHSDSYDSGELVVLGIESDLSPADMVEAAAIDATERVLKSVAATSAAAASAATAAAAQEAADVYKAEKAKGEAPPK